MTDRIDLDELAAESDDDEDDRRSRGDWFWRDAGDTAGEPADEPAPEGTASDAGARRNDVQTDVQTDESDSSGAESAPSAGGPDGPMPHVPREGRDRPVGIPKESGGAGGAPAHEQGDERKPPDEPAAETQTPGRAETQTPGRAETQTPGRAETQTPGQAETQTSDRMQAQADPQATGDGGGPHGGGVDDMTMALTYRAAQRLVDPAAALGDASRWADWLGIVGDVTAPVITKFQRDHRIDVDFFNGSGAGPGERLAKIDDHSMFYAERMVVVGVDGEEHVAEEAGWEFVPLSEAAAKAGWTLADGE